MSNINNKIGCEFIPVKFEKISVNDARAYRCQKPYIIDSGIVPSVFLGGCPLPPQLYGSFGTATLYNWTDYIKNKSNSKVLGTMEHILGTNNGITVILWNKNNMVPGGKFDGKFSTEMCTGWGTYTSKHIKYDYGWENGVIMNMFGNNENVPFIHIWYRTEKMLYMWEIQVKKEYEELAHKIGLLNNLKKHINYYFYIIDKTKKKGYIKNLVLHPDFKHFINDIGFMIAPINYAAPVPDVKYWVSNKQKHKN